MLLCYNHDPYFSSCIENKRLHDISACCEPSGGDITYARLGLGIRNYSENTSPIRFIDQKYLTIEDSPLATTDARWDTYIEKIGDTYFVLFSSASHGVHLASTQNLGIEWQYVWTVIHEKRENSCLSQYNNMWCMLIGMFNARGYDLYSSKDFLKWELLKRDWFTEPEYSVLPAGSTCISVNNTLYHLYQAPSGTNYISGAFSLKLAYAMGLFKLIY